jgi:Recombinase zinc beta ribbon domain/Recombinase
VISLLKHPFYAGTYAYGKGERRTAIVDGRARTSHGHRKPLGEWEVRLKDHHEGYIDWAEFERNQKQLAVNAYAKPGGVKSGRGGRALLAGLLSCGRCGRRLVVSYSGRPPGQPVYRCERRNQMLGLPRCFTFGGASRLAVLHVRRCFTFGGLRIDAAVARELLRAVAPMAIEAAAEAERRYMETRVEQQRVVELELQARYEASLADRRYAACDPDNRLIAAQLEKNWEAALHRLEDCQARLAAVQLPDPVVVPPDFTGLADDLEAAWNAPGVTMRTRQRLLRALVVDIITDVDDATREVVLTIHWRGGQHSQLRVRKPRSGEHGCRTPGEALAVMRSMATRWSDADIAATLNRMGMPTGQGKTRTAHHVSSVRRVNAIHAYRSADKNGEWLTMSEAAAQLGVTHHRIRRLIKDRILSAEQVVPGAPWIRAGGLQDERVAAAIGRTGRPYRDTLENQLPMFPEA